MLLKDNVIRKESGVLMPLSSLPSKYGIGSLGIEAYRFIDFLKNSRQRYWQILPLVPLGEGNSPYKSSCCFAGEILYIDIDFLVRDGLLHPEDLPPDEEYQKTDYFAARQIKLPLIKKAAKSFNTKRSDYIKFTRENNFWLEDYAVYTTAVTEKNLCGFEQFNEGLKYRYPSETAKFKSEHREEIRFYKIAQFLFYKQYYELKNYAYKNNVKIIGDIPFYVGLESSDVWSHPEDFRLGKDLTPVLVAGVPPDIFSDDGQLWGNPIYDWNHQKRDRYDWWKRRLAHCKQMYDVTRIDHFRAFASYYTITYGSSNAKSGKWEKGVGLTFWQEIRREVGKMKIIAEDLGGDEPDVEKLIKDTGFPCMKVLQFGFDTDLKNKFLPRNFEPNCVCYTGTHDNNTTKGWYDSLSKKRKIMVDKLTGRSSGESVCDALISSAMHSKAKLVIIPMQDWLDLDEKARMNTPGTAKGNWEWRISKDYFNDTLIKKIRNMCRGRN